jgi:hypothetical protein
MAIDGGLPFHSLVQVILSPQQNICMNFTLIALI